MTADETDAERTGDAADGRGELPPGHAVLEVELASAFPKSVVSRVWVVLDRAGFDIERVELLDYADDPSLAMGDEYR